MKEDQSTDFYFQTLKSSNYKFKGIIDINTTTNYNHSDFTVYSPANSDVLGKIARAGDIDGDGYDDLVFGSPLYCGPNNNRYECGELHIIFGGNPNNLGTSWDLSVKNSSVRIIGGDSNDQSS